MFRSLILAAALLAFTPLAANAGEITLLPSIKLQIGDRDDYGNYWDGGRWRDRDYWHNHYEWRKNRWWRHDNGYHRGWDKRKAYERGYREGWRDRDDHRGRGRSQTSSLSLLLNNSPMTPTHRACYLSVFMTTPSPFQPATKYSGRRPARQLSSQSVLPAACSPARPLA